MQTNDVGTSTQIAGLQSVAPDLERLEDQLACQNDETMQALLNFSDSPDLMQLVQLHRKQLNEFDLFRVLGVQDSELAHSNFLAWLLDPRQNHCLGAYFLKAFLSRTCREAARLGLPSITPARIHAIDWFSSEVRREWEYIDLLILNREAKFVCAIENKIWADEGIGADGTSQLTWYRETLKRHFPAFTKHYVFLSPNRMLPYHECERRFWTPEDYTTIHHLVEQTVDDQLLEMVHDVRVCLRQYAATLRRNNIVPEITEAQRLARQTYLRHREAIELIYRNKPDFREETKRIIKSAIADHTDWELDRDDPSFVYFQPPTFVKREVTHPPASHARYPLVCFEFYCPQEGNARFQMEIVPETESNKSVRDKVIHQINQNPNTFNRSGQSGTSWLLVHVGDYCLHEADLDNWDDKSTGEKIQAWVADFASNRFPPINDVIVNCLREYETETQRQ